MTSGLSPWLHFGHVSSFEVARAVLRRGGLDSRLAARRATGAGGGWWGISAAAEAFLDQLVTWRSSGSSRAHSARTTASTEPCLRWARATLGARARSPSAPLRSRRARRGRDVRPALERGAAPARSEGVIHNALRMLWGKKILEWSPSPRAALEVALELNDRWALDGRDPSSVSGVFWCLAGTTVRGGPERAIFRERSGTCRARAARGSGR